MEANVTAAGIRMSVQQSLGRVKMGRKGRFMRCFKCRGKSNRKMKSMYIWLIFLLLPVFNLKRLFFFA